MAIHRRDGARHGRLMMRRFRLILLAVIMLASGASVQVSFAQMSPTLKKIADRGAIVIGHREASVPFSYIDQNQKPIGFSVDLCLKIADAVKEELKKPDIRIDYVPVTPQTRFGLLNGPDIVLGGFDSALRVGIEQEKLAVGDPVSGSGATERLSDRRRRHRKADGEAHCSPRLLGQGERRTADDHALL